MADVQKNVNIVIGAQAQQLFTELSEAKNRVKSFESNLTKAAAATATAYAALKFTVVNALEAFAEQERIGNQLNQSLRNSGIFTDKLADEYEKLAIQTARIVGLDDDAVKLAMAKAQAYLGNIAITEELVRASSDLSVATGESLDDAMVKIAKSITTNTNGLAKLGIEVNQSVSDHERLSDIVSQVEARWGGQARASRGAAVAFSNLRNAAGDLYEELGARLAPAAVTVANAITGFIDLIKEKRVLLGYVAAIGAITTALLAGLSAIVAVKSAIAALGILLSPFVPMLTGAAATIGAAFSGITLPILAVMVAVGAATAVLLKNVDSVRNALSSARGAIASFFGYKSAPGQDSKNPQNAQTDEEKKQEANRRVQEQIARERKEHNARVALIEKNQSEILALQFEAGTKRIVDLKTQENSILKQLDDAKNEAARTALEKSLAQNRALQEQAQAEQLAKLAEFNQLETQLKQDAMSLGFQIEADLTLDQKNKLIELEQTEADAKRQIHEQMLRDRIEANNLFLQEQARYGTAFATINKALHSDEVQGAKSATGELVALTESKNATLKAIGKASAVTNIAIATAESAMNIFKGFSAIPIVGQALGIAGAAAAIAFGAERTAQVVAAADGGLVTGGVPGMDSVPAMLMPGELIVPKKMVPTFQDVMGSGGGVDMGQVVAELQALRGEIGSVRPNSVTINGDMMADDSFVDRMIQKISDRLEFGNAKLVGVNA